MVGAGLGLSSAGLQVAALEAAGAGDVGVASGVFSTSRYLGNIVGSDALAGFLGPAGDGVSGFGAIFLMAVGAALLSVPAGLALDERRG